MRFPTSTPPTEMPQDTSALTPDRPLRLFNLASLFLSLPFVVPYAVETKQVCPVLGLVPLFISALLSLLLLWTKHPSGPRLTIFRILIDFLCAALLIGILIPGWVVLASGEERWWGRVGANVTMCGTYGTVPMMVSFVIHTYLAHRDLLQWLRRPSSRSLCPHCHGDLSGPSAHPSYASVHSHEDDEEAGPAIGIASSSTTTKPGAPSNTEKLEIRDPHPEESEMPRVSGEYRDSCEDESAPLL